MSNIGKKVINIPENINIKIKNYNKYKQLIISSHKFVIQKYINFPSSFKIQINKNQLFLFNDSKMGAINQQSRRRRNKELKFYGTLNSFINQMIKGISQSFKQKINLKGIGYKIEIVSVFPELKNEVDNSRIAGIYQLKLHIGYSHPVFVNIPQNIKVQLLNSNSIELESNNFQELTQFIHQIIQIKPAYKDTYKQKGFELLN